MELQEAVLVDICFVKLHVQSAFGSHHPSHASDQRINVSLFAGFDEQISPVVEANLARSFRVRHVEVLEGPVHLSAVHTQITSSLYGVNMSD